MTKPTPSAKSSTKTEAPQLRAGISNATLTRLGIRRVTADEATPLVGTHQSGIYIPFPGQTDQCGPYGRLRLDVPSGPDGKKKYHQRAESGLHNYILPEITLHDTDLIMVEGEFKAISLIEAGFPAVGTSGFYSWGQKNKGASKGITLESSFVACLDKLKPKRIVYVGDPDTALNFQFSDAMIKLRDTTNLPVALFRIEYNAPHGKGVDDIKASLGDAKFKTWFQHGLDNAYEIPAGADRTELIFTLVKREKDSLAGLQGPERVKASERMVKLGIFMSESNRKRLATHAKEILDIDKATYKEAIAEKAAEFRAEIQGESQTPSEFSSPLDTIVMVGEAYYTYSFIPVSGNGPFKRSSVMSVCSRAFVSQSLKAAGYDSKRLSTSETPICGALPNLTEQQAAYYYLNATRCTGMADLLFRPYGPVIQMDGTRLFNRSLVKVMPAVGKVMSLDDDRLMYIKSWFESLFGTDEDVEHFISALSYTYKAARDGNPRKTRALFLIGPPNSGKSLLIDKVLPTIFGQETASDAYRLIRGEAGATSVLSSYVCKLSDKDIGGPADIKRMQDGILSLLADYTMGGRFLFENVKTVEVINLFVLSSNPDGSVVKLLQGMPPSVMDKFCVYDCGGGIADFPAQIDRFIQEDAASNVVFTTPDEELTPAQKKERQTLLKRYHEMGKTNFVKEILAELPYFCSLLENWSIKHFAEDRFGVVARIPEKYKKAKYFNSKEELISEILQNYDFVNERASKIYSELVKNDEHKVILDGIASHEFLRLLKNISDSVPALVEYTEYANGKNKLFTVTGAAYAKANNMEAGASPKEAEGDSLSMAPAVS
jgi:hypothetical protein